MKKLIYTLLAFAAICTSCVQDVDDVYDKPVAQRVEEAVQEYQALLQSSEHGWLMEYYPHSSQIYGGFNYIMKFKEGEKVVVATDAFGEPEETAESLFSVKKDIGPTLNFDTYNELFHYFADPDLSGGAGTGKGYEGDHEFLLRSHTENEIMLRGKKTKNIIKMTRLTEDGTPYLASAIKVDEEINSLEGVLGFGGTLNGKKLELLYEDSRIFKVMYDGETIATTAFMPTATGIQLYLPVEVEGQEFQRFAWSAANKTLTAENETNVILNVVDDPEYLFYIQYLGKYTMKYTGYKGAASIEIELVKKENKKSYTIKGMLPIDLTMIYNKTERRIELLNQKLQDGGEAYLAIWNVDPGNLTYGGTDFVNGMYGKLKEGTTNEYKFVDDGRKEGFVVRGMILWSKAGEYRVYNESRFADITLIKHE